MLPRAGLDVQIVGMKPVTSPISLAWLRLSASGLNTPPNPQSLAASAKRRIAPRYKVARSIDRAIARFGPGIGQVLAMTEHGQWKRPRTIRREQRGRTRRIVRDVLMELPVERCRVAINCETRALFALQQSLT